LREPPVFPGVRSQFFYVCGFEFIAFVRAIRVAALRQLYLLLDKTFGLSIAAVSSKQ
jgi:hypothetical protein